MDYKDIISKFQTPLYLYDIDKLIDRINYLKSKFPNTKIVYAVKANTFVPKEIEDEVDKYEICSGGEFDICNNLKINQAKMVISGVHKDEPTIDRIMSNEGIGKYTIESIEQFHLLEKLSKKYNRKVHVLIRLTSNNQFGVNEEEFKYILKNNKELIIDGLEYFSGTQKTSLKRINREVDYINEFVNSVEEEFNIELKEIEFGPGLPIHYFKDEEFDEDAFLEEMNTIFDRLRHKELLLEIGRSLVASCGYYFTKIVDMKTNKNGNYVIVDGGINHLVYYGQTMAMRIPYYDVYPKRKENEKSYNIYGSLCTINDIIVKNINECDLQIGDTFIFKNVGAYSSTEGISLFLSRDLPMVVLHRNNDYKVVRNTLKTSDINYPNY